MSEQVELNEETLGVYIDTVRWQFAKTMPENPHEYTLKKWGNPEMFDRVVMYIREHGYDDWFKGRKYIALNVGEHKYWTMGASLDQTILINRKELCTTQP